jgi:hypothetical protein
LQELAPNHLKLLWSKAMVVSVEEKSRHKTVAGVDQGDERKQTTDEVSKQYNVDVKTGVLRWFRDQHGRGLLTDRAASGIKVA